MPYKWIAKFKNWVADGFQELILESISGERFTTSPAWDLENIKKTFPKESLYLSEDEIEMYDEAAKYLVAKPLGVSFHVYVCDCPVQYDLIPYYDWVKPENSPLSCWYYLDFEKTIAALEKYKGYQLSVEITEGSYTQTNKNKIEIQQVFDKLKACKGGKHDVIYRSIHFDNYLHMSRFSSQV